MGACKSNKEHFDRYDLVINSKYLYDRLISLGVNEKKSLNMGKINVPDEYFVYFTRGYIDGDGSISYYMDKRKNNPYYILEVTILGSYNFLKWMQAKVHKLTGLPKRKPDSKTGSRIRSIRYRGSVAIPFCEWLYSKDDTVHNDIKKGKFQHFLKLDNEFGPYARYKMPHNSELNGVEDIVQNPKERI